MINCCIGKALWVGYHHKKT